jgi:two-component system response regulator QseB
VADRLLLAEDEPGLAGMLAELLAGEGYVVEVAADGQAMLHLGLTRPFDVLVVDRALPAIDGLDVLARLRSRGLTTPALMLTARGALADRVRGWTPAPTTTWLSRSRSRSCWPGSGR